jgi:hypothetical protein
MEFPMLVYKAEGRHSRAGGTYDFVGVNTQEEFDTKISEGWFESLQAAIEDSVAPTPPLPTKKSTK